MHFVVHPGGGSLNKCGKGAFKFTELSQTGVPFCRHVLVQAWRHVYGHCPKVVLNGQTCVLPTKHGPQPLAMPFPLVETNPTHGGGLPQSKTVQPRVAFWCLRIAECYQCHTASTCPVFCWLERGMKESRKGNWERLVF